MTKTKTAITIAATAILLSGVGPSAPARADSAQATCEVREDGKVKKDASGPCTFSQRQGNINITLANGFTHDLSPGTKPDHYRDAKGHKVERVLHGETETFKWDDSDKKIILSYGAPAAAGTADAAGGGPSSSERA